MRLVDAHCHLEDESLHSRLDEVLRDARDAGIIRLLTSAVSPEQWHISAGIARRHPEVAFALGAHPWYAKPEYLAQLEQLHKVANVPTSGDQINFCNTGHWASVGWFASSELLGIFPDVTLVIILVWSAVRGVRDGLIWAFLVGILLDTLALDPLGGNALALLPVVLLAALSSTALMHKFCRLKLNS